jgi:hypothetical protein
LYKKINPPRPLDSEKVFDIIVMEFAGNLAANSKSTKAILLLADGKLTDFKIK